MPVLPGQYRGMLKTTLAEAFGHGVTPMNSYPVPKRSKNSFSTPCSNQSRMAWLTRSQNTQAITASTMQCMELEESLRLSIGPATMKDEGNTRVPALRIISKSLNFTSKD